jgi:hypothetical protein
MRRRVLGNVALIDGLAALLLLALSYVAAGAMGSEIQNVEAAALDKIALENLREEISQDVPMMNMTLRPLDADCFEMERLRFSTEPPLGEASQAFFISEDLGVRVFYITEKD